MQINPNQTSKEHAIPPLDSAMSPIPLTNFRSMTIISQVQLQINQLSVLQNYNSNVLCNSCQRSWHWAWTCCCTIGLCCKQCGCRFVYAKCKLLFTTLTHLQTNSRSVVVCELASFYGSLVKKKKKKIWGVSVLHTWLLSYVWIACIPWKRCSASVSSTHSNCIRHTVCYTTSQPSDVCTQMHLSLIFSVARML